MTGDNRLLASAEGLPVHMFGMAYLAEAMTDLHDDIREGDAFLHNDPYLGNTHPADHTILVPVFFEGQPPVHGGAKAHQADCGNAIPTTYLPFARDVYEEGASCSRPCASSATTRTSTTSSGCAARASACRTSGTATTWRCVGAARIAETAPEGAVRPSTART